MKITRKHALIAAMLTSTLMAATAQAQVPKPGENPTPSFNNRIPDSIMTPDKVETRIGALNFDTPERMVDAVDHMIVEIARHQNGYRLQLFCLAQ